MANKEHKITKISRKIYMQCISSNDYVKALSLLLFVKSKFPTSVIPNYSTYKLAKLTKLDKATIKKYMDVLGDLELLSFEGKKNDHVRFNKVRNKKTNFSLKIDVFQNLKCSFSEFLQRCKPERYSQGRQQSILYGRQRLNLRYIRKAF